MSISLIAVFIPILMMGGIVGRLFREFAVILSVAIAMSMVISLTATPMMCARLLKENRSHGCLYNWTERFYQWIISTYASALEVVLRHPALRSGRHAGDDGRQRLPLHQDPQGILSATGYRTPAGHRAGPAAYLLSGAGEKAKWFEEQVRGDPDVETVDMVAGSSGGGYGGAIGADQRSAQAGGSSQSRPRTR